MACDRLARRRECLAAVVSRETRKSDARRGRFVVACVSRQRVGVGGASAEHAKIETERDEIFSSFSHAVSLEKKAKKDSYLASRGAVFV